MAAAPAVTTGAGRRRPAGPGRRTGAPLAAGLVALAWLLLVAGCGGRPAAEESLGNPLLDSASTHLLAGRVDEARHPVLEALLVARQSGDRVEEANSLLLLGHVERESKAWPAARAAFDEARVLYREMGDAYSEGVALLGSAKVCTSAGDDSLALTIYVSAVQHGKRIHEPSIEADALLGVGMIAAEQRPAAAREAFGRAARLYLRAGLYKECFEALDRMRRVKS